jgi:hypothetical protein
MTPYPTATTVPLTVPAAWAGYDTAVVLRAPITTDRYGAETRDWAAATETVLTGITMQPLGSRTVRATVEDTEDREWTSEKYILAAPSTADLLATDRVLWQGITLEMDGPSQLWPGPDGQLHHYEAALRRLAG